MGFLKHRKFYLESSKYFDLPYTNGFLLKAGQFYEQIGAVHTGYIQAIGDALSNVDVVVIKGI